MQERFYDAKVAAEWAARHRGYGARAKTAEDFERLTQEALEEYILFKATEAEALVVDLRAGWGGCSVTFLNLFNPRLLVFTSVGRDGKQKFHTAAWLKPVVRLVNGGSRSGKELVAFAMKQREMATLVGQRTAGAVLAGTPIRLSNGDLLYLAVMDGTVDGTRLEGGAGGRRGSGHAVLCGGPGCATGEGARGGGGSQAPTRSGRGLEVGGATPTPLHGRRLDALRSRGWLLDG